ncbi:hypothetical protein DPMN_130423 [Dreissena polymorpha]|uniref:Nerve growth factor-related domain-containing protein n=1 Tax=Dreissena polymorpha TaxID=45954 RepID=A0A9D4JZ58_DREPO|nr:hypothetical protein DPMN_130423 [Dreissena polymorpha]
MTKGQVLQLNVNQILNIDDSAAQRPVLVDNVTALMNVTLGNIHFTLPKTKQTSSKGKRLRKKNNLRHKRSSSIHRVPSHIGFPRKSCGTKSSYVFKEEAKDIFGDTVHIHPVIEFGKVTFTQYFRETFCSDDGCSCYGIDSNKFTSSCETTHSYTNAKVVKNGSLRWTLVKIRSGCACIINEKQQAPHGLQFLL